jgi:peptide deformylase
VPLTVLVNPRSAAETTIDGWEGCLSVPELRGQVPRFKRVRLEALDREGQRFVTEVEGFHARVIQHECDHLDGRVYLDRMRDMRSLAFLHELERYVLAETDQDE